MKNVVMLTYQFLPHNCAGTLRALGLAKYLPRYGYHPIIICNDYQSCADWTGLRGNVDESLTCPPGVSSFPVDHGRETVSLARRHHGIMSRPTAWAQAAMKKLSLLVRESNIHAVWAQAYPRASLFVANKVSHRTGVPWIADYLDPLDRDYGKDLKARAKASLLYYLERRLLSSAQFVSIVTPTWQKRLSRRLKRPIQCITNGYDHESFQDRAVLSPKADGFRIVYAGGLSRDLYRPLTEFLRVIRSLLDAGEAPSGGLRCEFYGSDSSEIRQILKETNTEETVVLHGRTRYADVVNHLKRATMLLFLPYSGQGRHTAKLFDYLASGKPILCYPDDPGGAGDLLRDGRTGHIADNEKELKNVLLEVFKQWESGQRITAHAPDQGKIEKYTWLNLAGELAALFDSCSRRDTR